MKLFSTKAHGVLDYLTAGALLALPRVLELSPAVKQLLTGAAALTTLYSLLTRYELGLVKLLPMRGHLALDTAQSLLFLSAPLLFPDEDDSTRSLLLGIGAFELFVTATSESETEPIPALLSRRELRERAFGVA